MNFDKFSGEFYKVGTRKEESETVKIMKISLILLFSSFFLLSAVSSNLVLLLTNDFLLFLFILSAIVFLISYFFSTVMIFISKQPREKIYLSVICYALLIAIVFITIISFTNAFRFGFELGSAGGEFSIDTLVLELNTLADKVRIYTILMVVLTFLFDLSMLLSFELKNLKDDFATIFALGVYLGITIIKPFLTLILESQLSIVSMLLSSVLWLLCLYFLLKNRMIEIGCLIRVDKDGNEIQEEKPKKIRRKIFSTKLKTALKIALVCAVLIFAELTFLTKDSLVLIPLGVGILSVGFAVSFGFYTLSGKQLRKIDFIGCFSSVLGLILLLIIYPLLNLTPLSLIIVFGALSFIALILGAIIFFFFQKERRKGCFVIKLIIFVMLCIVQIYYFACLFFAPELKEQLRFVIPVVFNVSIVTFALVYFLQLKSPKEIILEGIKKL